ncbi:hypothetical protein AAMO2058_001751000 [Amorphochlora amoebiformis]
MQIITWEDAPLFAFTLLVAAVGGYWLGAQTALASSANEEVEEGKEGEEEVPGPARVRSLSRMIQRKSLPRNANEPRHVVIVAQALPVKFKKIDGKWEVTWDDSRNWLAALRMLQEPAKDTKESYNVMWVGCVDSFDLTSDDIKSLEAALRVHNCVPAWIRSKELREAYFTLFGVLWRLFHYVMPQADADFGEAWDARWKAYQEVNEIVGKVVCENAHDDAAIWVHGYSMLLTADVIRKEKPMTKLGIFIHTPWPTTDVVRCLPEREALMQSVLSADIIGFHTYDYARHFLSACRRIAGLDFTTVQGGRLGVKTADGRTVLIEISHLGINSAFFQGLAESPEVSETVNRVREEHKGRQIIIAIDHLDMVKGTLVNLQAYNRFLEDHAECDDVTLIQVLLPSWNSAEEQKRIRQSVVAQVTSIHNKYGKACLKILDGTQKPLTVEDTISYYRVADVALITTFWDGLNLAPYEFTASQDEDHFGVLILSEFMGCSRSLSGALRVNPWSLEDVSEKLGYALSMSRKERKANHLRRAKYVKSHTTQRWARNFLDDMELSKSLHRDLSFAEVEQKVGENKALWFKRNFTHLKIEEGAYKSALDDDKRPCVFLLDYDGTLISEDDNQDTILSVTDHRKKMRPTRKILETLTALTERKDTLVFIISGRERKQLGRWFSSIPELGIAAEKGCFIRWPRSIEASMRNVEDGWEHTLRNVLDWKDDVMSLLKAYTERTDGAYIEHKEVSLTWHYEAADPVFGDTQASELHRYIQKIVSGAKVDITRYNHHRILEVKPKGVDKGSTVKRILDRLISSKVILDKPTVVCAGDEASDERMFKMLAGIAGASETKEKLTSTVYDVNFKLDASRTFTCSVGLRPSAAAYYVFNSHELVGLLSKSSRQ